MGARRRLPPHSPPRWAVIAAVTLCTDTRCCLTAAMPTATGSASDTASTLFACGSHNNDVDNSKQIVDLFNATKSVCCDDPREECNGKDVLPATCHTPGCARAVDIVSRSCAAVLADGFLGMAFGPALEPLVSACSDAEIEREPTYVISDPGLHAASIETCHGLVIDGAGSTFLPSSTGLDALVLRAPAGVQLQLTVEALCLPKSANVRIYDGETNNDAQLALLQRSGHHGDTFLSTGGVLQVQRSVDEEDSAGMPLLFGLRIGCVCSAEGPNLCGEHSSCVDGKCQCDAGYGGPMCESIVDKCKAPVEVDCGAHGHCEDGQCDCDSVAYSGDQCQNFDECADVNCGSHGLCVDGSCSCQDGYSDPACDVPPGSPSKLWGQLPHTWAEVCSATDCGGGFDWSFCGGHDRLMNPFKPEIMGAGPLNQCTGFGLSCPCLCAETPCSGFGCVTCNCACVSNWVSEADMRALVAGQ